MSRLTPPVRFLGAALAAWTALRIVFWTPLAMPQAALFELAGLDWPDVVAPSRASSPSATAAQASPPAGLAPASIGARPASLPPVAETRLAQASEPPSAVSRFPMRRAQYLLAAFVPSTGQPLLMRLAPRRPHHPPPGGGGGFSLALPVSPWRFSAWTLWNPTGDGLPAAGSGLLRGSQTGIRAQYRLTRVAGAEIALSARLARPIERQGAEAAIGIATRPFADVPLELLAERRIAVERGGRNAWSLGAAAGVDRMALPLGLELDAWAQAGVIGLSDRDLYGDLALAVTRPIPLGRRTTLSLGGGAWASAQPGAARLDVGPQAVLRVPAGDTSLRISLGWRQRVAGGAAPGSGPVATLGTDF